jgi:hypothetical protein
MSDVIVKVFKLSTGEEVIAELVKEEDDHYYCKQPFGVGVNQAQNLVFVPYMQYTNAVEEIVFHKHHVMVTADAEWLLAVVMVILFLDQLGDDFFTGRELEYLDDHVGH